MWQSFAIFKGRSAIVLTLVGKTRNYSDCSLRREPVIMDNSSWTYEEAVPDPMLAEQFKVALKSTQVRKPELIAACRDVMVEGLSATDAARQRNVDMPSISRAMKSIKEKWDQICAEEGWVPVPFAFPASWTKLLLEIQREQLDRYSALKDKGRKKKT
jgi:hypothetical protein